MILPSRKILKTFQGIAVDTLISHCIPC